MKTISRSALLLAWTMVMAACVAEVGPDDSIEAADDTALNPSAAPPPAASAYVPPSRPATAAALVCDVNHPGYQPQSLTCSYHLVGTTFVPPFYASLPGTPFVAQCTCDWVDASGAAPSCAPGQLASSPLPTCDARMTTHVRIQTVSSNPAQCASVCARRPPDHPVDWGCCS